MLAAHDRRRLLQQIIDDPASTTIERTEAMRVLGETGQPAPSHRRGRNANVHQSQADEEADIEQALTYRANDGLTSMYLREIEATFDPVTRQCLDAIGDNMLLQLFTNNVEDVPLLRSLVQRTGSSLARTKALDTLRLIAARSPIESARTAAQEFITKEKHDRTRPENRTNPGTAGPVSREARTFRGSEPR